MNIVFGVRELKYAIGIFKETKGVAMTTKFRQKHAKIAHILVMYKIWRHFLHDGIFGIAELKYVIRIFQGANGAAMANKCSQKIYNCNKLSHNFGPTQTTFGICIQRICFGSLNSLVLKNYKGAVTCCHGNQILKKRKFH